MWEATETPVGTTQTMTIDSNDSLITLGVYLGQYIDAHTAIGYEVIERREPPFKAIGCPAIYIIGRGDERLRIGVRKA
jgi:hypothetical protein